MKVKKPTIIEKYGKKSDLVLVSIFVLSLGIRLIGLGEPLVDTQVWRQTDTAAIARNYYEEGYNLFYPHVDWRGTTEGFVESNFPLYDFIVALFYKLDGVHEWVGRLVSAVFSSLSVIVLYLLTKRFYGITQARLAALLFSITPLNIFFGRAFMPEAVMIFLSISSIYFFIYWLDSERVLYLVSAVLCTSLVFLIKLPTLYLGLPLLFLAYSRAKFRIFMQYRMWLFGILVLVPPILWYWHAYNLFQQTHLTFGIWNSYGYDKWGNFQLLLSPQFYMTIFIRFFGEVFTPLLFLFFLVGIFLPVKSKDERLFHFWLLALVIYVLLVPEGNKTLNYYQLPFAPVGSIFASKTIYTLIKKDRWSLGPLGRIVSGRGLGWLSIAIIGISAFIYVRPFYKPKPYFVTQYQLGKEVDVLLPKEALIVVGDFDENRRALYRSQNPALLYFCHRKGWQIIPEEFRPEILESLRLKGASYFIASTYLVAQKELFWYYLKKNYPRLPVRKDLGDKFLVLQLF